ncbi:MAG: hypothetical protein QMD88_03135 [Coprothermobacterota bacterium]|nr:hypothetical protein [Coprothermobacterota bacterium]
MKTGQAGNSRLPSSLIEKGAVSSKNRSLKPFNYFHRIPSLENPVTRAEFAKLVLLYSLHKAEPQFLPVTTFPDVPSQHWAFDYVAREACVKLE